MFGDPLSNNIFELQELNTVCDVRDGTHDSPKYHNIGYPLITSKNIINGGISFDDVNLISKEEIKEKEMHYFVPDIVSKSILVAFLNCRTKHKRPNGLVGILLLKLCTIVTFMETLRCVVSTVGFKL